MEKIRRLLKYLVPYWGYAVLNIIFNLFSAFFAIFSLTLVIPFLQILFQKEAVIIARPEFAMNKDVLMAYLGYLVNSLVLQQGKLMTLFLLCLFVVLLFLLKNLFSYLALFFLTPVRTGVVRDLRNNLFNRLLILPLSFYSESKRGDLIARATNDVQEVESTIMRSFELFFREPVTIILFLATLMAISTYLTIFVLVLLPLAGLVIGRLSRKLRKKSQVSQYKMGQILSVVEETISGLRILKAFNALEIAGKKFREMNQDYTRVMINIGRKGDLSSPLSEFLGVVILVVIMIFGGFLVLNQNINLSAEAFIGFIIIFSQLINPSKNISTAYAQVQRGLSSLERIHQVMDEEEVIVEKKDALPLKEFKQQIEYQNISFAYQQENVLNDINLVIPKGQVIAFVGASGSGKSTLADLLPRFYDPKQGQILIDGFPIKDYIISDVRLLFGIVTQEPLLFNDTVFNNIAYGFKEAGLKNVMEAAVIANAAEFIEKLPDGYYTRIGERGSKLSGGQRQRLSIARAILRNPPLLILDEATSSLDSESEKQVQYALEQAMKGRTTIVIAHRFSTIQYVDQIVVLDKGRIIETGNHSELLEKDGIYKRLFDLQTIN
ncbi:MAG: ABC transporter ATP-binding protein [Bacteroidales bacterium]